MSLRQRLWDIGYAMAEPLIKTDRESKLTLLVMLMLVIYVKIGEWVRLDPSSRKRSIVISDEGQTYITKH